MVATDRCRAATALHRACAAVVLLVVAVVLAAPASGAVASPATPKPSPTATSGGSTPVYGLRPTLAARTSLAGGHFRYDVPAGAKVRDGVDAFNFSPAQLTLALYAVNAAATDTGQVAPGQPAQSATGPASWIRLSHPAVTLLPRQQRTEKFTVTVPKGTPPGDYLAMVVAAMQGGPQLANGLIATTRVALQVQIHVLGKQAVGLTLGPVTATGSGDRRQIELTVTNTGNVLTTPQATVDLSGAGGHRTLTLGPAGTYLIPGGHATLSATWTGTPTFGWVRLQPTVHAVVNDRTVATYTGPRTSLLFFPWWRAGLTAAALLALAVVGVRTRPRVRRWRARRSEERAVLAEWRATHRGLA